MKHLFLLKTFLITCVSVLIGGGSLYAQTTESIIFEDLGYSDGYSLDTKSVTASNFSLTFDKGTHTSGNPPKYYESDFSARVYKGNTMRVTSANNIEKIVITYVKASQASLLTADGYTYSGVTGTWTGKSKSVTFTGTGTSRITKIEVTITPAEGAVAAPTITPETGTKFDESLTVTITPAEASHTIWYTTDGTIPTNAEPSIQYTAPFAIDKTTTVSAIAVDTEGNVSSVASATYTKREFKFNESSFSVFLGASLSAATYLTNTYDDQNVSYSSSNPEVATIDAVTGNITLVADGETIITASLAGGQSASLILKVKESVTYTLVTSTDDLVAGARYLIANNADDRKRVIGWQKSSNRSTSNRLTISADKSTISNVILATKDADSDDGLAREFVLCGTTDKWSFYNEVEKKYLTSQSNTGNNLKATQTIDVNGTAKITFDGSNVVIAFNGTGDKKVIKYNPNNGSPLFSCYSATADQEPIQLYKLNSTDNQGSFSISEAGNGYSTLYTEDAFVMPADVKGAVITSAEGSTLTINYKYASGSVVPEKTPLLLKGTAGEHVYGTLNYHETAPTDNMLHGADAVDADGKTYVKGDNMYYVLSKKDEKMGFYWAAADGAAVAYQTGKAFLAVPKVSGAKLFSSLVFDDANTTGVEAVETVNPVDGAVYTLMGVCVGDDLNALPKGLYIRNGKKVLVK